MAKIEKIAERRLIIFFPNSFAHHNNNAACRGKARIPICRLGALDPAFDGRPLSWSRDCQVDGTPSTKSEM